MIVNENMKPHRNIQTKPTMMRTLDKYPMKYNNSDTNNHINNQRMERTRTQMAIKRARNSSQNLSNYTKRLFDDALTKVQSGTFSMDTNPSDNKSSNRSYSLPSIHRHEKRNRKSHYVVVPLNSGPTQYGSVLYNKKSHLMNSIRTRSNSEPPAFHISSTAPPPDIRCRLKRSNSSYKVITPSTTSMGSMGSLAAYSCPSSMGYQDFILIPHNNENDVINEGREESEVDHKSELMNSEACDMDAQDDQELQDPPGDVMVTNSDNEAMSSDYESEESQNEKNDVDDDHSVSSQRSSAASQSSPKTDEKNKPNTKRSKKKKKCWVDDATVSSIPKSEPNSNASQCSLHSNNSKPSNKQQTQGKVKQGKAKDDKAKDELSEKVEKMEIGNEDANEPQVVTLQELHEQKIELPNFICPSSEDKSRQTRIKDWLDQTSFGASCRAVPLI